MFFLASSRCSAGDPVSAPGAEDNPFVKREGLIAMLYIWPGGSLVEFYNEN